MNSIHHFTFLGVASTALALPAFQSINSQLTRKEYVKPHNVLVFSITEDTSNDPSRHTYETHDELSTAITDYQRDTLPVIQTLTTRDSLTITINDIDFNAPSKTSKKSVG